MLYMVYAVFGVCCTQCILDLVYAVLGVCCTGCMLVLGTSNYHTNQSELMLTTSKQIGGVPAGTL